MILKIVVIALIFAVLILYLRTINSELAILATIASSVFLIITVIDGLGEVFSLYERISQISSLSESSLKIILKVTAVSYLIEFSASIVEEFGLKSLADKLVFAGKVVIILLAVPIIESVFTIIEGLL